VLQLRKYKCKSHLSLSTFLLWKDQMKNPNPLQVGKVIHVLVMFSRVDNTSGTTLSHVSVSEIGFFDVGLIKSTRFCLVVAGEGTSFKGFH